MFLIYELEAQGDEVFCYVNTANCPTYFTMASFIRKWIVWVKIRSKFRIEKLRLFFFSSHIVRLNIQLCSHNDYKQFTV